MTGALFGAKADFLTPTNKTSPTYKTDFNLNAFDDLRQ
jgi:hypothetical protein